MGRVMTRPRKGSKRQARRASIERKRNAFGTWKTPPPGNKKAPAFSQGYDLSATGAPTSDPVAEPNTPDTGALSHELFNQ